MPTRKSYKRDELVDAFSSRSKAERQRRRALSDENDWTTLLEMEDIDEDT